MTVLKTALNAFLQVDLNSFGSNKMIKDENLSHHLKNCIYKPVIYCSSLASKPFLRTICHAKSKIPLALSICFYVEFLKIKPESPFSEDLCFSLERFTFNTTLKSTVMCVGLSECVHFM